ncbi:MAG: prepilin-type N-terminal cleavage/methylation domain-containing protein [Humidesulfovibrio sp.]|nr:prepilin-type N-terminal cleavage/methylation domain-containing protein [Humidesulfovibrio sp.]
MTQAHRGTRRSGTTQAKALCGGFTLIELITVLIILGLLSALVLAQSANLNGELAARLSEVRSQLRYVQLSAMKSGSTYLTIQSDGANYWAQYANATYLLLPGETSQSVSISAKSMVMPAFNLRYDSLGIPYDGTTGNKLSSAASITITANNTNGTLTVTPETGFVQ